MEDQGGQKKDRHRKNETEVRMEEGEREGGRRRETGKTRVMVTNEMHENS